MFKITMQMIAWGGLLGLLNSYVAQGAAKTKAADDSLAKMTQYFESGNKGQWPWPDSLDATIADSKNHTVLLENDRIRVLQVTIHAHEKEDVHTHRWPSVFINPVQCKSDGRLWDGSGHVIFDTRESGPWPYQAADWRAGTEPPHAAENMSDEDCTFYRVEIKQLTTAGHARKWPISLDGPTAAPKNHKVILENEFVRVLELSGDGYEKEKVHTHPWPSVAFFIKIGDSLLHGEHDEILVDTRTLKSLKFPIVIWDDYIGPHWGESIDGQSWHGYRVELKQ